MKRKLLIISVLIIGLSSITLLAQENWKPEVHLPVAFDISPPLRDISPEPTFTKDTMVRNPKLRIRNHPFASTALPKDFDEAWQKEMGTNGDERGAPTINFEGINNINGSFPPDTQGDVGPNHYFQVVNVSYQIFDKQGTSLVGPFNLTSIWSGFSISSISDPIVLYDEQADRWFISVFKATSPYSIYIAVSTSGDPTGSWYRYQYNWATQPDYAKYGIWQDGYYYASNTGGQDVGVFERARMLTGHSSPRLVTFDNPNRPNSGFHCIMPLDNDGPWAPGGEPGHFVTINDDAWGGTDQIWIYELDVNYATPASSTFTRTQQLAVSAFDTNFGPGWDNITQPGTAQKLDAVPEVFMFRAQYRNFGTHESIVACHSVDVNNTDRAGVRWYELRRSGANWFVRQQSTYSPTTDSRWMGGIAMNKYGDIALGYSVSSGTVYPSIRYTGRKAGDALSTMTMTERTIFAGSNSQTGANRWGDYSGMSVDPSDDVRFWFTNEYSSGGTAWRTRIAAFSFSSYCYASGGCTEHISRVQAGSIDHSTGCTNYGDYTLSHSTNVPLNSTLSVTITNGPPAFSANQCGIWVDWNRDGDFNDVNESVTVSGTPGVGPYTALITPPAGTTTGPVVMRVRITWTGDVLPCGTTPFGEVEDYTLNLTANATTNIWVGDVGLEWHTPANWSLGQVPVSTINVSIPSGTLHQPAILSGSAYCNNLTIQGGASLTQNSTSYFYVGGNFNSDAGLFTMNGNTSFLYFTGTTNTWWDDDNENDTYTNVRVWKDTPTAQLTMWQDMTTSGTFQVWEGIFAIDASWTLNVTSTSSSAVRVDSGGTLSLLTGKSISVAGGIQFLDGSQTDITGGTIRCGGDFRVDNNTSYNIALTNALLVMNGSGAQSIVDMDGGNLQLHHLTIDKPGGTATITNAYLNVSGNLLVQSGTFNLGSFGCSVLGNTEVYGTLAMTTGTVGLSSNNIFWRSGSVANITTGTIYTFAWSFDPGTTAMLGTGNTAYIRNMLLPIEPTSHFGNLVIQPFVVALTGELEGRTSSPVNVAGNLTVENGASWSFPSGTGMFVTGNSNIQGGGSLAFQGGSEFHTQGSLNISGNLAVQTGGNVLVNSGSTFPASGTLNITGGNFVSDNAFTGGWTFMNGSFNMTNGLFELTNNAPNFTATASTIIGGGIFRAGVTMAADFPNFNPTGGVVEITGVSNGNLFMGPGSSFYDLTYNSVSGNTLFYQNNITVRRHLAISAGTIRPQNNTLVLNVGGNFTNSSPHTGYDPLQALVVFNGDGVANHQHLIGNINFYNVTNAKTGGGELRFTGSSNIANDFLANGVNVVSGASLNVAGLLNLATGQLNLTVSGPIVTANNFTMGGILGVAGGSFTCTDLTHHGILGNVNLSNGSITLNQVGIQYTDLQGHLSISGGSLTVNGTYSESIWGWGGIPSSLTMTNGILDFNNPGIFIGSGYPVTTAVSGGLIRTSGLFVVDHPGFTPGNGSVELYGGNDAFLGASNGAHVHNLTINKSGGLLMSFDQPEVSSISPSNDFNREIESGRPKFDMPSGRSGNTAISWNDIKINNNLTVNAGKLVLQHPATNAGNVEVNNSGKLEINNTGSLAMGASRSLTVNNGGALELNGSIDNQPKLSRISSGNYALNIESGATIGAVYALLEHMNTSGVHIKAGATIDPVKAFNYCTFRNGQSGGRLLTINNSQTLAMNYVNFPNNTWGGNYNVQKSVNTGVVTFGGYSGLFSGEANEFDPNSRLHWGGEIATIVNLQGVDIMGGQELCFEATNTLTLAGSGSTFVVQNGAIVNLVAGQKISMLDGTHFHDGSYVLARITTTSDYCSLPPALLAFGEEKAEDAIIATDLNEEPASFRVYPNPTTGRFTLEIKGSEPFVTAEIFGLLGERILQQQLSGNMVYEFDLSSQPRGVYLIRVQNGDEMEMQRLIRQ